MKRTTATLLLALAACGAEEEDESYRPLPPAENGTFVALDRRTAEITDDAVVLTFPDGRTARFTRATAVRPYPERCPMPLPAYGLRHVTLQPGSKAATGTVWLDAKPPARIVRADVEGRFAAPHAENSFTVTSTTPERVTIVYAGTANLDLTLTLQHVLETNGVRTEETAEVRIVANGIGARIVDPHCYQ